MALDSKMNYDEQYDNLDELPASPRKDIAPADLELLTLAARALGARFEEVDGEGYGNLHFEDGRVVNAWNSLQFSGDAFELLAVLQMDVWYDRPEAPDVTISPNPSTYVREWKGRDIVAATRRAVTRAAAEIGKQRHQEK